MNSTFKLLIYENGQFRQRNVKTDTYFSIAAEAKSISNPFRPIAAANSPAEPF